MPFKVHKVIVPIFQPFCQKRGEKKITKEKVSFTDERENQKVGQKFQPKEAKKRRGDEKDVKPWKKKKECQTTTFEASFREKDNNKND